MTVIPKFGDRVRATLGKSINEGVVTDIGPRYLWMHVEGATLQHTEFQRSDWFFEILTPSIPDVEGTICRGRSGQPVWRERYGWCTPMYGPYALEKAQELYGPLVPLVAMVAKA